MKKHISSWKIILRGNLIVNLPVTVTILGLTYIIVSSFGMASITPALLLSSYLGWTLWGKLLEEWRRWGIRNSIEPERMYRLGKLGLINFYRYRIIKNEVQDEKASANKEVS